MGDDLVDHRVLLLIPELSQSSERIVLLPLTVDGFALVGGLQQMEGSSLLSIEWKSMSICLQTCAN